MDDQMGLALTALFLYWAFTALATEQMDPFKWNPYSMVGAIVLFIGALGT